MERPKAETNGMIWFERGKKQVAWGGMESLKIIGFSVLAAICYGILHDQVTAHLCVEYFTVAHPPVFPTRSPFLLAIGWGVIATWWVGLPLGVVLAATSRLGPKDKLTFRQVRSSILRLMTVSAIAALLAGLTGAVLVATGLNSFDWYWRDRISPDKHVAFTAATWAHSASYLFGFLGGLFLIGFTIWRRLRLSLTVVN